MVTEPEPRKGPGNRTPPTDRLIVTGAGTTANGLHLDDLDWGPKPLSGAEQTEVNYSGTERAEMRERSRCVAVT